MKIGRVEIHSHWLQTIALDIVLLIVVTGWYMVSTVGAPWAPGPGHTLPAPILAHQHLYTCSRLCNGGSVFRTGYVGPATYAIVSAIMINWLVLLSVVMIDFLRVLWGPPPSDLD